MFAKYIEELLNKAVYEKDDDGVIVARIPWYQGYYTQWASFEEAREHLVDVIEIMMIDSIKSWDADFVEKIKSFSSQKMQYA
jgi:predicted RNase H-like HicB family nuclease